MSAHPPRNAIVHELYVSPPPPCTYYVALHTNLQELNKTYFSPLSDERNANFFIFSHPFRIRQSCGRNALPITLVPILCA